MRNDIPIRAMTVRDVATYVNINEGSIYRWARSGELKGAKVAGRWRFERSDVDKWFDLRKKAAGEQWAEERKTRSGVSFDIQKTFVTSGMRPVASTITQAEATEIARQIDFRTITAAKTSIDSLALDEGMIQSLMNHVYGRSPAYALKLSKAILRQSVGLNGPFGHHQIRALMHCGCGMAEARTVMRRTVCTAFRESRMNLVLMQGIAEMKKLDARSYMKQYFDDGGDIRPVLEWLEIAGRVLRNRQVRTETDWNPVSWVKDRLEDAWDATVDAVEDVVDAAGDMITTVVDAAESAGQFLSETVSNVANWGLDRVTDLVSGLIEADKTIAQILKEASKVSKACLKKFVKAVVASGAVVNDVVKWAEGRILETAELVVKAMVQAGHLASDIMESAVELTKVALKKVVQALHKAGCKVGDILVEVVRKNVEVIRTVLEGLLATTVHLSKAISSICTDIADNFRKGFFEGLLALAIAPNRILLEALKVSAAMLALAFAVFLEIWGGYRKLTTEERREARKVFGWSIDLDRIKVAVASIPADIVNWLNGTRPFTTMYLINFASWDNVTKGTLIHELTHVWQGVMAGPVYMVEAIHSQYFGEGYEVTAGDLAAAGGRLGELEREQQAVVVQRYWESRYNSNTSWNWRDYEKLAKQVYRPRPSGRESYSRYVPTYRYYAPRLVRVGDRFVPAMEP